MDPQEETILRAIIVSSSSSWSGRPIASGDRQSAFSVLEDFAKFPGRVPMILKWLQQYPLTVQGNDCTVSAKLYGCELLAVFVKKEYSKFGEQERVQLRYAVLAAARVEAVKPRTDSTVLANKLSSLLANLLVRDFPQRWPTCMGDLLSLWSTEPTIGNKIVLEVLRLVAEDCTDSDFNAKISTKRRNDVLLGLNEVASQFLPCFFRSLELISTLTEVRGSLHNMRSYLVQNQLLVATMTTEQATMYKTEQEKMKSIAFMIVDTLTTLVKFCATMPLEWMITDPHNFSAAFFHLMREPTEGINLLSVECLHSLCHRGKLTYIQWMQWMEDLPSAVQQVNQQLATEQEYTQMEAAVIAQQPPVADPLTTQLGFHRGLANFLSTVVSSHLCHITYQKKILTTGSKENIAFGNFLRLLVGMLHHPSPRVVGEEMQLWIALLRDPNIAKTKLVGPVAGEVLSCFLDQMIRIRWEDVEEGKHPQAGLLEASWDDDEEYLAWVGDYRSKASQLFRYFGNNQPNISASILSNRVRLLLATHGNGEPKDHLHPSNLQLTQESEAVRQLEGVIPAMLNILQGLPEWSMTKPADETPGTRAALREETKSSLGELVNAAIAWNPNYLWLKFRRTELLDASKYFWKHDPATLLQGVDALLGYVRCADEWGGEGSPDGTQRTSGEAIGLRKRASSALVSIGKRVPHHLVPWLAQLSEAIRGLLSSSNLAVVSRMHMYEFLSCVATAVQDPGERASFIENVLSDAMSIVVSVETQSALSSVEGFLASIGASQAKHDPSSVIEYENVNSTNQRFQKIFSAFNQLLSVGKRCHEAAKRRPNAGIPVITTSIPDVSPIQGYPDEGPISIRDLAISDPFVPLWPRILPHLIKLLTVVLQLWRPEHQAVLLSDRVQRYVLAISDDDAFLAKKVDNKSGGVFGEGGTAGSVIPGTDRRATNLAPKWSSWLNELRNVCIQMLGLASAQRVLYAPELSEFFPVLVGVIVDPDNLRAMEHRHMTQFLKQVVEFLILTCPSNMYGTHLASILGPVVEHMKYRLEKTWDPMLKGRGEVSPLFTSGCENAARLASTGGEDWFQVYYARSCLFVGDLDSVTAESAVEKARVELTRIFGDVLQVALALKGDWALVLANIAKEEQAGKNTDSKLDRGGGPATKFTDGATNADGTPKKHNQAAIDARKLHRINSMCHFLFLENEQIAGFLTLTTIQCLQYPDAYTCRRITRVCHRILEATAWHPRYASLLGSNMLSAAIKNVVTEPKWMVGTEWDVINVVRDIYVRLSLGQVVQPGGQGAGLQQPTVTQAPLTYEQTKYADRPLQGGGILTSPTDLPRDIFASLPGITVAMIQQMDVDLRSKRSAKAQKDIFRDMLRIAADNWAESHQSNATGTEALDRAIAQESLLHNAHKRSDVQDLPEKLVTHSMVKKNMPTNSGPLDEGGIAGSRLFG